MSDIDLDAIEARANAATPGPWYRVDPPWGHCDWVISGHEDPALGGFVADCEALNDDDHNALDDADFIAAARTDIPALIARVREQEQEIAKLREVVAFFGCTIRSGEPWSETCQQALDECQP